MAVGAVESSGQGTGLAQTFGNTYQPFMAENSKEYFGQKRDMITKAEEEAKKKAAEDKKAADAAFEELYKLKSGATAKPLVIMANKTMQDAETQMREILARNPSDIAGAMRVYNQAASQIDGINNFQKDFVNGAVEVAEGSVNGSSVLADINSFVEGESFADYVNRATQSGMKFKKEKNLQSLTKEAADVYAFQIESGNRLQKEADVRKRFPNASEVEIQKFVDDEMTDEIANVLVDSEIENYLKQFESRVNIPEDATPEQKQQIIRQAAVDYVKTLNGATDNTRLQTPRTEKTPPPTIVSEVYSNKPVKLEVIDVHQGVVNPEDKRVTSKEFEATVASPRTSNRFISVSGTPILLRAVHKVKGGSNSYAEGLYMPPAVRMDFEAGAIDLSKAEARSRIIRVPIKSSDLPQVIAELNAYYKKDYSSLNDYYKLGTSGETAKTEQSSQTKKTIKSSDIPAKAKAAGYSVEEYTKLLKEKGITIE